MQAGSTVASKPESVWPPRHATGQNMATRWVGVPSLCSFRLCGAGTLRLSDACRAVPHRIMLQRLCVDR